MRWKKMSSVELISKNKFESFLPRHYKTNKPLWQYWCYRREQHIYRIFVDDTPAVILINSTVDRSGYCSISQERGIRIWCVNVDFSTNVIPSHIKRTKGWEKRLNMYLKYAYICCKIAYDPENETLIKKHKYILDEINDYKEYGKLKGKERNKLNDTSNKTIN